MRNVEGSAPSAQDNRQMAGVGLVVLSTSMFPLVDSCAKWLSLFFPVMFVLLIRFVGSMLLEWLVVLPRLGFAPLRAPHLGLHIARSAALALATMFNFIAVQYLPLTTTVTIIYSVPFIVALLAPLFLGERLAKENWFPMLLGFLGVTLVIQPGLQHFQWEMLYSVACAVFVALYSLLTRAVSRKSDRHTISFFTSIVGVVIFLPSLWFLDGVEWPQGLWPWVVMAAMGFLFAGIGHQFMVAANRRAPAPMLAPYMYTNIIIVVMAGYFFFGDVPDMVTVVGTTCTIAAGIWLARLDSLATLKSAPPSLPV